MRRRIASPWRLCAHLLTRLFAGRSPWTLAAFRRRRLERATRLCLEALDARTLRDLGIDPGEIPFLAARVGERGVFNFAERSALVPAPDYLK